MTEVNGDPFGHDPMGHICTTYNIYDPRPGECPAHEGLLWHTKLAPSLYCHEHREWHSWNDVHDECEACELERNVACVLSDQDLLQFASGSLCDDHVREAHYERPAIEVYGTPEHEAWLIEMEKRDG
jgi:hypothetical protein